MSNIRSTMQAANSAVTASLNTVDGLFQTASAATGLLTNRVQTEVLVQQATIKLGAAVRIADRTKEINVLREDEVFAGHYDSAMKYLDANLTF